MEEKTSRRGRRFQGVNKMFQRRCELFGHVGDRQVMISTNWGCLNREWLSVSN